MKLENLGRSLSEIWAEVLTILQTQRRQKPFAFALFTALCLNLIMAPVVYAATGGALTRQAAYAVGALLLVTIGLSVYLFAVILQPERF